MGLEKDAKNKDRKLKAAATRTQHKLEKPLDKLDEKSIRLQLFSKCSFNPMSVIGYDVG